jgi:hypothetical protein
MLVEVSGLLQMEVLLELECIKHSNQCIHAFDIVFQLE